MRHELFAGAVILDRPYLPTDDKSKLLMMAEAAISLCIIAIVASRAVGILSKSSPFIPGNLLQQRWSRKSERGVKWSFCLTAGTLCPANQERP